MCFAFYTPGLALGCGDLGPFHGMAATVLWSFGLCLLILNVTNKALLTSSAPGVWGVFSESIPITPCSLPAAWPQSISFPASGGSPCGVQSHIDPMLVHSRKLKAEVGVQGKQ